MIKPNGYDETQAGGYIPVELGGHYASILKVEETTSSTGKPMLKVAIDFDAADVQPNYFMEQFKADVRPDKKYPYQAIQNIVSEGADGKCTRAFKSFITCFENSNNCKVKWDASNFAAQFVKKKIGVVFGNVEEEYNGEIKNRRRIRWFCDYQKAKGTPAPADKLLDANNRPAATSTSGDGFMNVPDGTSEEIPFPM